MIRSVHEKISLFVCGAQKAGTTSLHAHFQEHSDLSAPVRKELHFFDDEHLDWSAPNYDQLHAQFVGKADSRLRYEITPVYMFWPQALERLFAYNPLAKLIFIFRDPFERAFSHWAMEWARNAETLPFSVAIRSGRNRLKGLPVSAPEWRVFSYLERGLYGAQIRRALEIFPRDQMLFLLSDDLRYNHASALRQIAKFADISDFTDNEAKQEHVRSDVAYPSNECAEDRRYVADFVKDDLVLFGALTGLDISSWPTLETRTMPRIAVA